MPVKLKRDTPFPVRVLHSTVPAKGAVGLALLAAARKAAS